MAARIVHRILEGIRGSRRLCIVGHIRPDGDCIGSQLGLALALRDAGKQVTCWNADPLPRKLAFLDPGRLLQLPKRGQVFDGVIATDAASFERLGQAGACLDRRQLFINIDHHASNTRYADLNWIEGEAPSTGELILQLLKAARWPVTPAIADCLYTAIATDTGSFQYPSTQPATYRAAGELVQRGAHLARICREVYQSTSLARLRLLQHMYRRFQLAHHNQVAWVWLKPRDFARAGATPDEAEELINHLRDLEPVVVACVFEQLEPRLIRLSLRSKSAAVNVGDLAARLGGGGHAAAAGARIPGSPAAVQRAVLRAVQHALNSAP